VSSGAAAGENALIQQQQQLLQQHNPYYQHLSPPSHLPQHAYYNPRQTSSNGEQNKLFSNYLFRHPLSPISPLITQKLQMKLSQQKT